MHDATGSSTKGWEDAILDAIAQARKEVDGEVIGFEVVRFAGETGANKIRGYRATVRVAYRDRVAGP